MRKPSSKQGAILKYLEIFIDEKGYPPSVRQIQGGCGISSTSVVDYNLRQLENRNLIRRDREVSRGIEILGDGGVGRRQMQAR
ncbi:MAG: repressor LexA, partial [Chloroflexi bacterium]|nr:repressor LexA [Chloroflexota bacterium]